MKKKRMKNPGKKFTPHRYNKKILFTFAVLALSLLGLGTITVISQRVSFTTNQAATTSCSSITDMSICSITYGCGPKTCGQISSNNCPTASGKCTLKQTSCTTIKDYPVCNTTPGCSPHYSTAHCEGNPKTTPYWQKFCTNHGTDESGCKKDLLHLCSWKISLYDYCQGTITNSPYVCTGNNTVCTSIPTVCPKAGEVTCDTDKNFYHVCSADGATNPKYPCSTGTTCFTADGTAYHPYTGCFKN